MFASGESSVPAELGLIDGLCRSVDGYSVRIAERDPTFDDDVFGEVLLHEHDPDVAVF